MKVPASVRLGRHLPAAKCFERMANRPIFRFSMKLFSVLDLIALAFFIGAWLAYHVAVEWTEHGRKGLNSRMNVYRDAWMIRMLERDVRIVDTQIMASLQNGTAFFASTSLIAIGGTLTLMRSTDDILQVGAARPLGIESSRALWEIKTI